MADRFTYDVFLSHNSQDKSQVRNLAERLKEAGLRVWFDEWAIKPGDDIYLSIERGLEAARVQVLCLSPAALGSDWVALERSTVLFRDPTNAGRRFVPLLLADCNLPDTLRRYKHVDFRQETVGAFDELLAACRVEGAPTAEQPVPEKKTGKRKQDKQPGERAEPLAVWERKLTGHEGFVNSVAVSPDGKWAASGSDDDTVKVWDLKSGKCRKTLNGHKKRVTSVAITPDGGQILSGSDDETVRVWNVKTGQERVKLEEHTSYVRSLTALKDGNHVLSSQDIYQGVINLKLWDLASRSCIRTIPCGTADNDGVFSIAVNPNGTQALSGHRGGHILLWDLETSECLATLKGHSDAVYSIQITPDGQFAVSGSDDMTVKIWDLEAKTCFGTLEGHSASVMSVAISIDGSLIASTGFIDDTVRLWDLKSGACLQVIELRFNNSPISVAFSPDGSRLAVGTTEGSIFVYRLSDVRAASLAEPARCYVNAKVVLLGEGTVGKTSLAYRLIEDKYVVKDRTHGMNVWPLQLPLLPDVTLDREALLWDLAGQEDYRLIHRLFLDETALALLLINPQKDDPFAEAGDWLKALDTACNGGTKCNAERLLVFSQVDVGYMKLSDAKIERFARDHGFAEYLATSAKTGLNCSDGSNGGEPSRLKQLIADRIPWDMLPWTATPRLLAELKEALMKMRDTADIRMLRFSELAQRLEEALPGEQFGKSEVRTAVTLLANHGLALPLKFGDLVLLQPELLNGYAGAIIRAARTHQDEIGCVLESDIYSPDFDFTGVDRLPRPDEELLLRAMVQTFLDHSLCIAEETPHGRELVFPSQYRREKDIPHDPNIFVSYTFGGEWQTIWTTLVVRLWYSQEFEHKELWRNAAEFSSRRGHLLGMKIDNRQGEGQATISLFFDLQTPEELKVIFIEYVHQHLDRYGCNVTRDRRYVCTNCSTPVTDLNIVQKRLQAGKDFITCQNCDERVQLIDFIEQRLKSDPVARRILAMEQEAKRQLDAQSLEQILIGHMMAICGEASQVFRTVSMFDYGIDGEVEFRDDDGQPSGRKIYVQLKSGNSYLRTRRRDGREIFDVENDRHLEYWVSQPIDVYLVIRQTDERTSKETIRWMNVTRYLKGRKDNDKESRQIIFEGEDLTMKAVWKLRDEFFPPGAKTAP
ncbi:MAG: TIR domain-containing protein [Methanothrix sp.]|nr:TIR domain-containing protein [Methanothrix sp.]